MSFHCMYVLILTMLLRNASLSTGAEISLNDTFRIMIWILFRLIAKGLITIGSENGLPLQLWQ